MFCPILGWNKIEYDLGDCDYPKGIKNGLKVGQQCLLATVATTHNVLAQVNYPS